MSTDAWLKTRNDTDERPVPDGMDPDTAPAPPLAAPVRREPRRVAELHHEVGVLIAAAVYASNELSRHEQDSERPHLARALAVLRDAVEQVSK